MNFDNLTAAASDIHQQNKARGFWQSTTPESFANAYMLIISEAAEVIEAERKGAPRADTSIFAEMQAHGYTWENSPTNCYAFYQEKIKGSIEEEVADVAIRLLDLIGALDLHLTESTTAYILAAMPPQTASIATQLLGICADLIRAYEAFQHPDIKEFEQFYLERALAKTFAIASSQGIDLKTHIHHKLMFNQNRPYRHGKNF